MALGLIVAGVIILGQFDLNSQIFNEVWCRCALTLLGTPLYLDSSVDDIRREEKGHCSIGPWPVWYADSVFLLFVAHTHHEDVSVAMYADGTKTFDYLIYLC